MSDGRILFEQERKALAEVVKLTFERKLTNVAGGNFSFKAIGEDGKEYIIMTPTMMSEAYLGNVSPSQILVVEPHTRRIVAGEGSLTREINMHEASYDADPNIKCVFHSHAPHSMFWATSGLDMPNLTEATQKVEYMRVLPFAPNCSEELACIVSKAITEDKEKGKSLPHEYLLDSHGVLITTDADNGIAALHKALSVLDTVEWNADIAYKQTIMQTQGLLDGYYSKGVKVGTLEDLKNHKPIWNDKVKLKAGAVSD